MGQCQPGVDNEVLLCGGGVSCHHAFMSPPLSPTFYIGVVEGALWTKKIRFISLFLHFILPTVSLYLSLCLSSTILLVVQCNLPRLSLIHRGVFSNLFSRSLFPLSACLSASLVPSSLQRRATKRAKRTQVSRQQRTGTPTGLRPSLSFDCRGALWTDMRRDHPRWSQKAHSNWAESREEGGASWWGVFFS